MVRGLAAEMGLSRNELLLAVFFKAIALILGDNVIAKRVALGMQVATIYVFETYFDSGHLKKSYM